MRWRYTIDPERIAANRRRNRIHAAVLIGAMTVLLAAVGWLMAGPVGLAWIAAFAILVLNIGPRFSQRVMLQLYSASELRPHQAPLLYELLADLRARAQIQESINLYYIPSRLMLAFTVGGRNEANIALSDGLLRQLTGREIAGVLAHEIAHIAHGDLKLMALADFLTKVTRTLVLIAMILLIINLPYLREEEIAIPWPPILLLALAPMISVLLQLGLSRAREYDADARAAMLMGDPEGIATALRKMDAQQRHYWESVLGRGGAANQPSILRTHPKTEERIERLAQIAKAHDLDDVPDVLFPDHHDEVTRPPRRRFHGFRY